MFCPNCGAKADEGLTFCPNCGTRIAGETAAEEKKQVEQAAPDAAQTSAGPSIGLPIAALVLSWTGIIGVILAIVAKVKLNRFVTEGGQLSGKTRACSIISTLALVFGIIMTAMITITALGTLFRVLASMH